MGAILIKPLPDEWIDAITDARGKQSQAGWIRAAIKKALPPEVRKNLEDPVERRGRPKKNGS